jgi:hypothetical protein
VVIIISHSRRFLSLGSLDRWLNSRGGLNDRCNLRSSLLGGGNLHLLLGGLDNGRSGGLSGGRHGVVK